MESVVAKLVDVIAIEYQLNELSAAVIHPLRLIL